MKAGVLLFLVILVVLALVSLPMAAGDGWVGVDTGRAVQAFKVYNINSSW